MKRKLRSSKERRSMGFVLFAIGLTSGLLLAFIGKYFPLSNFVRFILAFLIGSLSFLFTIFGIIIIMESYEEEEIKE